ncbi:MAG: carboxypeptidase regulatory-like domain-containing protein [Phycisphaerae bacterium]
MSQRYIAVVVVLGLVLAGWPAAGLIMVGGKDPVSDGNWPAGAVEVANHAARQSFYEGPPFGGGQYVFQYRGDAVALNEVLAKFGAVKAPELLVVVHPGPGANPFGGKDGEAKRVDWTFTVWTPENFHHLHNGGTSLFMADHPDFRGELPPPRVDVFVSDAGVKWDAVKMPANVRVVDERAAAHGYAAADGAVMVATVYDGTTSKPVVGAELVLSASVEKWWEEKAKGATNADGRVEVKNVPAGGMYAVVRAVGYAPRLIGFQSVQGAAYKAFTVRLTKAVEQAGRVTDTSGQPIAGAEVRVDATVGIDGRGYPTTRVNENQKVVTDAEGKFVLKDLPAGQAMLVAHAKGWHQTEFLKSHAITGKDPLRIVMAKTGGIKGKVIGAKAGDTISVWPEGGSRAGTWGGSRNLEADGTFAFEAVPPGKYFVSPHAGAEHSGKREGVVAVEVRAGEVAEVEIRKSAL